MINSFSEHELTWAQITEVYNIRNGTLHGLDGPK